MIVSPIISRKEYADRIEYARRWRSTNKTIFDAIYGPEGSPTIKIVLLPVLGKVS